MLIQFIFFLVGLLGATSISYGCYLMAEPAGFISAGFFGLLFSFLASGGGQVIAKGLK